MLVQAFLTCGCTIWDVGVASHAAAFVTMLKMNACAGFLQGERCTCTDKFMRLQGVSRFGSSILCWALGCHAVASMGGCV